MSATSNIEKELGISMRRNNVDRNYFKIQFYERKIHPNLEAKLSNDDFYKEFPFDHDAFKKQVDTYISKAQEVGQYYYEEEVQSKCSPVEG